MALDHHLAAFDTWRVLQQQGAPTQQHQRQQELWTQMQQLEKMQQRAKAVATAELVPRESIHLAEAWLQRHDETHLRFRTTNPSASAGSSSSSGAEELDDVNLDAMPQRYQMLQWLSTAFVQAGDCKTAIGYARRTAAVEDTVLPRFWPTRHGSLSVLEYCLLRKKRSELMQAKETDPSNADIKPAAAAEVDEEEEAKRVRRQRRKLMKALTGNSAETRHGNWAADGLRLADMIHDRQGTAE